MKNKFSDRNRKCMGFVSMRTLMGIVGVLFLVGVLIAIIVAVVVPSFSSPSSRMYASSFGNPARMRKDNKPIPARTVLAENKSFTRTISAGGVIAFHHNISVRSDVVGFVNKVNKDIGEKVQKGDLLLTVNTGGTDVNLARLDMELKKSLYDKAVKNYEREKKAFENETISQIQLDQFVEARDEALVEYEKSQEIYTSRKASLSARLANAAASKDDLLEVRSLVDGIISDVLVNEGENIIRASSELMRVGDQLVFKANIDQQYAADIQVGDQAEIFLQAYPGFPFVAKIVELNPVVRTVRSQDGQAQPYTFPVMMELQISQSNPKVLFAGMNGYCVFDRTFNAVGIPQSAVVRFSGKQALVMVLDDENRARVRKVSFVSADKGFVAISNGLQAGERVILEGQVALVEGDLIDVKE